MERNIDELLTDDEKEQILKESREEDIIRLFKQGVESKYKPPKHNADPLDQAITVAITSKEKDFIKDELKGIRKTGGRTTVSSFCRKRTIIDLDVIEWRQRALVGIRALNSPNWNRRSLESKRKTALKRLSRLAPNDNEGKVIYQNEIKEFDRKLKLIERPIEKRKYRIKIRFTYNEAKKIRWRASRLALTVADYIRFILFDYLPYSKDDRNMSVNYRRHFYLGIVEVSKNGWGNPPSDNSNVDVSKYIDEINELKRKNNRLRAVLTPQQVKKLRDKD